MLNDLILVFFLLSLPLQFGRHFWPESAFLFGLKVDFLSPTFYLQDILLLLMIFLLFKINFKSLFSIKICLFFILYSLFFILNIVFSLNPLSAFFVWLRITEFILAGIYLAKNSPKVLLYLNKIIPFWIVFEFVLGFSQVWLQRSVNGIFWFLGERSFNILTPGIARASFLGHVFLRPYGTFSHPNSLAGFLLVGMLILASQKLSGILKISLLLGLLLLFLCFSRVVWFCLLLLGMFYLLSTLYGFSQKQKKPKFNFLYLVTIISLPVIVFLFSRTIIDVSSFQIRENLANISLQAIRYSPVFGVGLNNFIVFLSQKEMLVPNLYWLQPVHNIFLLIGAEVGLIGLIFFIFFLFVTIRKLVRSSPTTYNLSLITALFAILFTGFFDHYWLTLIQNQLLFVLVISQSWASDVKIS